MRSYGIPFLLAGLIVASAGDVEAQRTGNREMHARINALRNRLQNYQLERVREEPRKVVIEEEKETVEVKFEQLIEDFETRKDVAVTVLFHDEDFARRQMAQDESTPSSDENLVLAGAPVEPVVSDAKEVTETVDLTDAAKQLEFERAQRQEKYEALRRRVHMATRRIHEQARDINSMVAQVP